VGAVSAVLGVEAQLRLVGAAIVGIGLAHAALPRVLGLSAQLAPLPALSRQVMHAHNFFIGVTCVLLGALPLLLAPDLLAPAAVPRAVLAAEAGFWALRWGSQFVTFNPSLWRGSRLYTAGWWALTVVWTWITVVFGAALAGSLAT
jgi:hypothetical protein